MPSYLDLGLIAVVLISALLAMLRGFTREIFAIASWIAAAAAARYLYPYLLPYIKPYLSKEPWASIASATAIFLVALILVSIITVNLSDSVRESRAGAVDRSLGFLFGAARGFLLCVIAYLFFSQLTPADKQPEWIKSSRMRPYLQSVGDDMRGLLQNDLLNAFIKPKTATPAEEPPPESDTQDDMKTKTDNKSNAEQNSPAPLPPARNDTGGDGGKEP